MTRKATDHQLSIEDFDLGAEHIAGGMPPAADDVEKLRAATDEAHRATYHATYLGPPICLPEQRIHVYAGNGPCQCKEIK